MFAIDIILTFFTSYVNMRGTEIFKSQDIALNYLSSFSFYSDVLSLLGSDFLEFHQFAFIRFVKLTRIHKIDQFIKKSIAVKSAKIWMIVSKLIFYLLLFIHFSACVWYITVLKLSHLPDYENIKPKHVWITPLDTLDISDRVFTLGTVKEDGKELFRYLIVMYYSILMMTTNNSLPQDYTQMTVGFFGLLTCLFINFSLLGTVASLIASISL